MKKIYLLFILLFAFTQVSFGQTVTNGNFETWTGANPDGWTLTPDGTDISFAKSTLGDGKGGSGYALKVTANSNGGSYDARMEYIITDITAGINYGDLTIYTKSSSGNKVWLRIWDTRWYDASDATVGSDFDESTYSSGDNSDWKAYTVNVGTAPTNAVKLRVHFRVYVQSSFTAGDYILVDDLTLNGVLPVELTSFTAASTGSATVVLNWTTATEVNNYGFEIEAELSGKWTNVGFVEGHGNSNAANEYSYLDNSGATSYRLKQLDTDGGFEYSDVVTVAGNSVNKLNQNYPNPFNPTTQISFSIAKVSNVNISVYNALGQKVAEVLNQNMNAGNHTVNFNGSNLASGFYFYRLETPNYSKTMKMLLIK